VLGALRSETPCPARWEISSGWRYQHSHRHFSGSNEQFERAEEGSQVKNTINLAEVGIRRYFDPSTNLTLSIPYWIAERSSPIRDENDVVVDRTVTHAQGLSDVSLTLRRAIWNPESAPRGNVTAGIGVKIPTGSTSIQDTRTTLDDGEFVREVRTVDQSIQPGDGGFGIIMDLQAHRQILGSGKAAWYGAATYLSNPRGTNGAQTYRGDPLEAEMSVADQYLARTGFIAAMPFYNPLTLSIGGRLEGVPAHDMIGPSDGFRRPGYAFSVEPGASWSNGWHTVSVAVPVAVARERVRNVADLADGGHGDAAFADYIVLLGYWRRF
jgi:hypothetical protein